MLFLESLKLRILSLHPRCPCPRIRYGPPSAAPKLLIPKPWGLQSRRHPANPARRAASRAVAAQKRPRWRPGPSQTRVLGRARGYPIRERSARRGVARRLLSCAVSSLRSATFACAPRATSWRQVMHRRPVDNVDSRVRSQTYGLKKNCTAFSAVRG